MLENLLLLVLSQDDKILQKENGFKHFQENKGLGDFWVQKSRHYGKQTTLTILVKIIN